MSTSSVDCVRLEQKRLLLDEVGVGENGVFCGYASVFGKTDLGGDRIERGAFSSSLNRRGREGIRMLFQHDPAQPIGSWDVLREDARGLYVEGRIAQSTQKGREVLGLLRQGALDGLSIGFRTKRSRSDRRTGIRSILEADLWEISIVTFPMLPQARVQQVKSVSRRKGALPTVRTFEHWLTQDAGLTRSEARTVIAKGFAHLMRTRDAANNPERDLVRTLRSATNRIPQPGN